MGTINHQGDSWASLPVCIHENIHRYVPSCENRLPRGDTSTIQLFYWCVYWTPMLFVYFSSWCCRQTRLKKILWDYGLQVSSALIAALMCHTARLFIKIKHLPPPDYTILPIAILTCSYSSLVQVVHWPQKHSALQLPECHLMVCFLRYWHCQFLVEEHC